MVRRRYYTSTIYSRGFAPLNGTGSMATLLLFAVLKGLIRRMAPCMSYGARGVASSRTDRRTWK